MIAALLLAAALPQTAVDAERAFAADAQRLGQWTAFRQWATADATMFVPQPVKAQAFLAPLKNPPKAIAWSPAASFFSCDGTMAANTGPWQRPDGAIGYFSTIWVRQPTGQWKWSVDGGDELKAPRAAVRHPAVRRASCTGRPGRAPSWQFREAGIGNGVGASPDGTLAYQWHVGSNRARDFRVYLWTGKDWDTVISDSIAPPPQ